MSKGGRRKGLSKEQPGRSDRSVDSSASQVLQSADQASDVSSGGSKARGATSGIPVVGSGGSTDALGTSNERSHAEAALATAQRQIQCIIDNTPAIVYAFDLEERFVMANAALAEVLGSTPEQLIGKRRHEFMPKQDADRHEANDHQVIEAGKALELEEYSELPDRSITWLTTKFPLRDAQGKIYAVAGISADITARKQVEASLREIEAKKKAAEATLTERQRFYDVLETLPVYVVLLSVDHRIHFANRFFRERFGESNGQQCFEHLFHRTEPCEKCESFKVLTNRQQHHWYWTVQNGPDYDVSAFPFTDTDGVSMVLEMGIDITDMKKAQSALEQLNATLEQRVADGTTEVRRQAEALRASNEELTLFNKAMVDRELRMIELKQEINALLVKQGMAPKYEVAGE